MTPKELRDISAKGQFYQPTSGFCAGHVQANLVVVSKVYAEDFEQFCKNNPRPCPVLEMIGPGSHRTSLLADNADLLNTVPEYRIWKDGRVDKTVPSIEDYYTDDLVFFLIGCSFSFEQALMDSGIQLRHVTQNKNVAMFDTDITLTPAGPFSGNMVVSMRPVHRTRVAEACIITGKFPEVHGAPVHIGYPEMIGINDIQSPDYGDAVEIKPDELPVFWACGVTPQNALIRAALPFAVTHSPGFMFVGDMMNTDFQTPQ